MAEFVSIDISALRSVIAELERRHASIGEVSPTIAEILVTAVHEEFETEGHGKWQGLAASTLAKRRQEGRGAKILQDSGLAAGSVARDYGADFAEAFTNVPYMVFHTSDAPRQIIPYRNPFDIDQEVVLEDVTQLLLSTLVA